MWSCVAYIQSAPDASWRIWRDRLGWCKHFRGGSQQVSHSHNAFNGACSLTTAELWFIWCPPPLSVALQKNILKKNKKTEFRSYLGFQKKDINVFWLRTCTPEVLSDYVQMWYSRQSHPSSLRAAPIHWRIICGHCQTDRKQSVTACSFHWQCVCSPADIGKKT